MTERGESLVEVAVALLLLSVGALGAAGGIAHAHRGRGVAHSSGLALAAAEGWLEGWRAGPAMGGAEGTVPLRWGAWSATLAWETAVAGPCVESARVAVAAADGAEVRLSSRRLVGGVGCGA